MTEQELRALVREAIAQVRGPEPGAVRPSGAPVALLRHDASHAMFGLPSGADGEGPCLIEPAVACNHCGYCQSYGH